MFLSLQGEGLSLYRYIFAAEYLLISSLCRVTDLSVTHSDFEAIMLLTISLRISLAT